MISAQMAFERFQTIKPELGIPEISNLSYMEKRIIEIEVSGILPEQYLDAPSHVRNSDSRGATPGKKIDQAYREYRDTLSWVGRYTQKSMFWEITLDENGRLIRLRKSR